MSKRTESMLPMDSALLNTKVVDNVQNRVFRKREQLKVYYDCTNRSLCTFEEKNVVRGQPLSRIGIREIVNVYQIGYSAVLLDRER